MESKITTTYGELERVIEVIKKSKSSLPKKTHQDHVLPALSEMKIIAEGLDPFVLLIRSGNYGALSSEQETLASNIHFLAAESLNEITHRLIRQAGMSALIPVGGVG